MKKLFTLFVLLIFLSTLFTVCKKDKGTPPALPPEASFLIDFSNFNSGKSAGIQLPKGVEDSNWSFAALVAGYFKALIVTTLAVPVASFSYAVDQNPVNIGDNTWQWSFSAVVLQSTYKGRLTGQIRTSDVLWQMNIAKEGTGAFAEFVWFQGTSKLDGTGGQWTLNYSQIFKEPLLQIDWTRTGTTVTSVKYTYVRTLNDSRSPDPFKNSYILYGTTTGTFDSYYTIHYYDGVGFSDVNVEWSSTVHNGRVKCQPFFSDTNWHCWGANYANIICP